MEQFQEILIEKLGLDLKPANLAILKRNRMLNTKNLEVLSDEKHKTLAQLRIKEGTYLFVEDTTV